MRRPKQSQGPATADEPFRLSAEPEGGPPAGPLSPTLPGQDELNLAEFPIALVTDRIPAGQKTLRFEDRVLDEQKGQVITRRLVVTASDEYGLPTAKDDEVILGLIQLTQKANEFKTRTVDFNRAELVRLLRWPDTGPSYRRLALSLKRWLGVSLYYENAWWDHRQKRWTSIGFHILDNFLMVDGGRVVGPRVEPTLSQFTWNENVFRNFDAGHLKQLDLDFYFGLVHPTAKRMYRFLDKRFHHQAEVVLEIKELAFDHIGLSRNYEGATQLARKLQPAVDELEEKGFLEPLGPDERYRKDTPRNWSVVFRRRGSRPRPVAGPEPQAAPEPPVTAEEPAAADPISGRADLAGGDGVGGRGDRPRLHGGGGPAPPGHPRLADEPEGRPGPEEPGGLPGAVDPPRLRPAQGVPDAGRSGPGTPSPPTATAPPPWRGTAAGTTSAAATRPPRRSSGTTGTGSPRSGKPPPGARPSPPPSRSSPTSSAGTRAAPPTTSGSYRRLILEGFLRERLGLDRPSG